MAELTGSEILAKCLKAEGVKDAFYIMGGPMLLAESCAIQEGIRMIDVRHEQAAATPPAQAYSRLLQKPGVRMAASGPAAINLSTGLANALIDCCPRDRLWRRQPDQPVRPSGASRKSTRSAIPARLRQIRRPHPQCEAHPAADQFRLPEGDDRASPVPSISTWPGDILLPEGRGERRSIGATPAAPIVHASRPYAEPKAINAPGRCDQPSAERPIIASGGGVIWSQAWNEMREFVEKAGIPFYTSPRKAAAWSPTTTRIRT